MSLPNGPTGACAALVLTLLASCGGSFCPSFECVGGAWLTIVAPDGDLLPGGSYTLSLTADGSSLGVGCLIDGSGSPQGRCADGFEAMDGPDDYWVSFEPAAAESGAPTVFARVFRRESAAGGVHTYGPEHVQMVVFDATDRPIASVDAKPTYVRKGSERCGECDEPDDAAVIELVSA